MSSLPELGIEEDTMAQVGKPDVSWIKTVDQAAEFFRNYIDSQIHDGETTSPRIKVTSAEQEQLVAVVEDLYARLPRSKRGELRTKVAALMNDRDFYGGIEIAAQKLESAFQKSIGVGTGVKLRKN